MREEIYVNPQEFKEVAGISYTPIWATIEVCPHFAKDPSGYCDCSYASNIVEWSDGTRIHRSYGVSSEMLECTSAD